VRGICPQTLLRQHITNGITEYNDTVGTIESSVTGDSNDTKQCLTITAPGRA
jgi:hypothetical protein